MSLTVDTKKIEGSCAKGGVVSGSFTLYAKDSDHIAFMLRTSDRRIHLSVTDYNGIISDDGIKAEYEIRSYGFDQGTVFKGSISVISNRGEERIPVVISIIRNEISSSQGPVRNLFHFANLAKESFTEAVNIFYTDEMSRIFSEGDRDTYFKYRAFRGCDGDDSTRYAGVEEFLIETNKKSPVLLSFAEGNVMQQSVTEDEEISITVKKSGWGYAGFTLESTDDFIELKKTEYTAEDFEGNFAEVRFVIKADRLHDGHNFGGIALKSLHTGISIPVFVDMPTGDRAGRDRHITKQMLTAKLMREFIRFRIGDATGGEWIEQSNKLLERLLVMDRNDPEARLMQSQLLLAAKRYDEADVVLAAVERELEKRESISPDIFAYLIYLKAMSAGDDKVLKNAVRQVWDIYDRDRSSWRVLWILIYL
ncbi:MAG: tetratricopeptide repeat protein, partial [Lachnospiraceae bacterium]|nr:tetratricopeptide repeat protein [Lachnospiraceae bacterium]